jgi:putative DNA primase/helicase
VSAPDFTAEQRAELERLADGDNGSGSLRNPAKLTVFECARALLDAEPYAVGGAQLYVYRKGCYRPGARRLAQQTARLLGDAWSKRKADEVAAYMRATVPELWDRPPLDVINVRNGLLRVGDGTRELLPHSPEHLSPVQIAAAYDPAATCPRIDAFTDSTIPALAPIYMEVVGLLLTPDNRYQKAVMCRGPCSCLFLNSMTWRRKAPTTGWGSNRDDGRNGSLRWQRWECSVLPPHARARERK